jgi:hypothetical protein
METWFEALQYREDMRPYPLEFSKVKAEVSVALSETYT